MGDNVFGKFSVATVTPFIAADNNSNQPVDESALESILVHVASGLQRVREKQGFVGGIIVSGTTGEQHTMTVEERSALYIAAVATAGKYNVPIAAGIAGTTIATVVRLTTAALSAGCQGIMLGLPPYCRLSDEEVRVYIGSVKSLVPEGFPILLYNNAMRNGYSPSLTLLAELCANQTLWGIKHAVLPDEFTEQALKILELCPSARLFTGSDKMAADLLPNGASPSFYGLTSILGNLYPEEMASAVCDLTADDADRVQRGREAHAKYMPIVEATLVGVSLPVGLKYAMRHIGLNAGYTREPVGFMSEAKKAEIDRALL